MVYWTDDIVEDERRRSVAHAISKARGGGTCVVETAFRSYGPDVAQRRLAEMLVDADEFLAAFDAASSYPYPHRRAGLAR